MTWFIKTIMVTAAATAAATIGQWLGERLAELVIDRFDGGVEPDDD